MHKSRELQANSSNVSQRNVYSPSLWLIDVWIRRWCIEAPGSSRTQVTFCLNTADDCLLSIPVETYRLTERKTTNRLESFLSNHLFRVVDTPRVCIGFNMCTWKCRKNIKIVHIPSICNIWSAKFRRWYTQWRYDNFFMWTQIYWGF